MSKFVHTAMLLVAAVIGLTFIRLSGAGNILETRILDISNWLLQPAPKLIVVNITDSDYDKFFKARSPLEPQTLHGLINAIANNNPPPALIAVDIDTSDESFRHFNESFRNFKTDQKVPVIWERELWIHQKEPATATSLTPPGGRQEDEIVPLDVLAGQNPDLSGTSGVPELRDDPADKLTRYYTRCAATAMGPVPSFVKAVAVGSQRSCLDELTGCKDVDTKRLYYITYSNIYALDGINNIPAKTFLEAFLNHGKTYAKFEGKIVLLGGSYRDFDRHFTPLGTNTGVEILANAIQTELGPVPIPVFLSILSSFPGLLVFVIFDVIIGTVIIWLLVNNKFQKIKTHWRVRGILAGTALVFLLVVFFFSPSLIANIPCLLHPSERVISFSFVRWLIAGVVSLVQWLIAFVFAIVPALLAVFIVVFTEFARGKIFDRD